MKFSSSFFVLCALFLGGYTSAQSFQISAYYSPLPGQEAYVSGSYEDDLRMNGDGTHGADGTSVYFGMISAPSKYDFGTKIFIPGLGVGTVHDRGGGIYADKGYDRLDIWMGYGDVGRKRALQWGRRIVEGEVLSSDVQEGFVFSDTILSSLEQKKEKILSVFTVNLWKGQRKTHRISFEIMRIQDFLGCKKTGVYDAQTVDAVYAFQYAHGVLKSRDEIGAGTWGPKTRKVANTVYTALEKKRVTLSHQLRQEKKSDSSIWKNGVNLSTFEIVRKDDK